MILKSSGQNMCLVAMVSELRSSPCAVSHFRKGAHSWVRKTIGITMDGEQSSKDGVSFFRPLLMFWLYVINRLRLGCDRHHS